MARRSLRRYPIRPIVYRPRPEMPAGPPAFGDAGTQLQGTATSMNVDVPDNVAADDIVIVVAFVDTAAASITALASGFAHAPDSPVTVNPGGGGQSHTLNILWKRATGADSTAGTYDFTLSGSVYRNARAFRYTNAVTSGSPWDVTASASDTTNGTASPAVSDTTTLDNTLLIWAATDWSANAAPSWTPPAGYTERFDVGDAVVTMADLAQPTQGSTGSVSGSNTGSGARTAWIGALKPVGAAGGTNAPAEVAAGSGAAADAVAAVAANAESTAATGVASDATVSTGGSSTNAPAEATTATGAALDAAAAVGAQATEASATGSASDPTVAVSPSAATATATGAAPDPQASVAASAASTAATGAAGDPAADVRVNADAAAGTGVASDATVSTSANTNAPAESAAATGVASAATVAVTVGAEVATAVGTAQDPSAALTVSAASTAATGSAPDAQAAAAATPAEAAGTATAADAVIALAVAADVATAAGVAGDPSVVVGGPGNAFAQAAIGSGAAFDAKTRRVIPRPGSGTTVRPGSGVTARPYSGTTARP